MALSEYDKRKLDEMEREFHRADEPAWSSKDSGRWQPSARAGLVGSAIGLLTGLAVVLIGLSAGPAVGASIGVVGFLLILGSSAFAVHVGLASRRHPRSVVHRTGRHQV